MIADGVSVANPSGPRAQHTQLRPIDGDNGLGGFEKENRQSGKCANLTRRRNACASRCVVYSYRLCNDSVFTGVDPQQRCGFEETP